MSAITKIDKALEGQPETVLSIGLILTAIVALVVAFFGSPSLKAAVLAWMVAP